MRIALLAINTLTIYSEGFQQRLETVIPTILMVALAMLAVVVYRTQRRIWTLDMADKAP